MSSLCSTMESSSNSFICCFGQVRIVWSIKKMKELELDSIVEHREELLISSQENDLVLEAVHFLKPDGPMLFVLFNSW